MRNIINSQLKSNKIDIAKIKFDPKCRDDIPKILRGLQYIYVTSELRMQIFEILEKDIAPKVSKKNGRPGMELWNILVLGILRLDLNCDYDRIQNLANSHIEIRQILGHADFNDKYHIQTIKDNLQLLDENIINKINEIIIKGGHGINLKKFVGTPLHGRCDSFVVKTNVHYPTDSNLLYDAIRKIIQLIANICRNHNISDLRQHRYNIKQCKSKLRKLQKINRTNNEENKKKAHKEYLSITGEHVTNAELIIEKLKKLELSSIEILQIKEVQNYIIHAKRQVDQIERRVINGEIIPHDEKVFSIFKPYTEWISKGKLGTPVELGLRVCILQDQHQFILHHKVMVQETDEKVAVEMVQKSIGKFNNLETVSFDKGFHSPENQTELAKILKTAALPRKGKLSAKFREIENSDKFRNAHKRHSAVESAINNLEVHGLDTCPDNGLDGFKRYVALAVLTSNIHRIGEMLYQKEQKRIIRIKNRILKDEKLVA